jgi:serine O-acetyltransferase
VLGASRIGADVVFAANSFVVNADVPDHSIVVGQYPRHRILPNPESVRARIFDPVATP